MILLVDEGHQINKGQVCLGWCKYRAVNSSARSSCAQEPIRWQHSPRLSDDSVNGGMCFFLHAVIVVVSVNAILVTNNKSRPLRLHTHK